MNYGLPYSASAWEQFHKSMEALHNADVLKQIIRGEHLTLNDIHRLLNDNPEPAEPSRKFWKECRYFWKKSEQQSSNNQEDLPALSTTSSPRPRIKWNSEMPAEEDDRRGKDEEWVYDTKKDYGTTA